MSDAPIEVTTRYATSVDDLTAAWTFVMERLDSVGPDPSITIKPVWRIGVADMEYDEPDKEWPRHFSVVVEGMVPESAEESDE